MSLFSCLSTCYSIVTVIEINGNNNKDMSGPVFGEFGQYWGKSSQTLKYVFELLGFENFRTTSSFNMVLRSRDLITRTTIM